MAADDTPFFSRWSRRKVLVREGVPVVDVAPQPPALYSPAVLPVAGTLQAAPLETAQETTAETAPEREPTKPLPTLADVAALNRDSDYTRFVAQGVAPEVKNAALKKLFTDPHFNVMDGLDTYVDDYSKPDPLPPGMLRQMVQSKLLGLFDDEEEDLPPPVTANAALADTATSTAAICAPPPTTLPALNAADEDLALQLQPDPAAGRAGLAPGTGEDAGRQH